MTQPQIKLSYSYMVEKKVIATAQAPQAIGPYSQGVQARGWLFISGQIPIDPKTNKLTQGNISQQTERVLENIKSIIQSAGGNLEQITKTTVYLKDMNDFQAMNEVYARYFKEHPPARAAIEVNRLPKDVNIEIDAIATVGA